MTKKEMITNVFKAVGEFCETIPFLGGLDTLKNNF